MKKWAIQARELGCSELTPAYTAAAHHLRVQAAEIERLRGALEDMHAGWRYIRRHHGDLPGVGWDRCDIAARAALAPTQETT